MRDKALWDKLAAYDFPLSYSDVFLSQDVADAAALSTPQVKAVMTEYRRFLYLAAVAGEVVAPSRLIDDIWHLHMQDTRAYLNGLCEGVIGKVIHHMPGRAAPALDPAYLRTLAIYYQEFGIIPDKTIWPTPAQTQQHARANMQFGAATCALLAITLLFWSPLWMLALVGVGLAWFVYYIPLHL